MQTKLVGTAVGATLFGALLGWAATADYYEKLLRKKDDSVGDIFITITEASKVDDSDPDQPMLWDAIPVDIEEIPRGEDTDEVDGTDEVLEDVEPWDEEVARSNLQHIIDQYTSDDSDRSDEPSRERPQKRAKVVHQKAPYVISQEAFSWDEVGESHEKYTVTYYPAYGVVVDEDSEVMAEVGRVLGFPNLNRFGDQTTDPDVVFIRNEAMLVDYEVIRETENRPPLHVLYGMEQDEFNANKAAGRLRLRDEDM
jgi:hypothetical protein